MELIKKVVKYLLANPLYAVVVAVCCVAILAVMIALCVKSSKAKKAQITQPAVEKKSNQTDAVSAPKQDEIPKEAQKVEQAEPTKTVNEPIKSVSEEKAEAEKEAPVEEKKVPVTAPEKKESAPTSPIKEEKAVADAKVQDEAPVKKSKRYNGKWVIWRLITKNIDETQEGEESYFFELLASNGEKLLSSEEYTSFAGAQKGIQTHKANILKNNFRICLTKKGDYIFKLLNGKGFLLCTGENYPTQMRCEKAIESTKRFAETAIVDENIHDLIIQLPPEDNEEAPVESENGYTGKWVISSEISPKGEQIYYFELFASNGEKLLSSEEYTTYNGVINGINTHKNNIERNNFRISLTKRGDYIFKLLNANDQLLCLGEHYKTRRRCENAVDSVKRFAKTASIMDSPSVKKLSQ